MTGDEAMALVQAKKDRRLNTEACMRFARTLASGGGSLADLDDALWLADVVDAAVAEALAARDAATAPKLLTLDDIIGRRVGFCGVDNNTIALLVGDRIRAFEVVEDEEDGYRSSLEEVREVPLGDMIHFGAPVAEVVVTKIETTRCDGYQLADDSGHVWLQVGTDDSYDYYPCFVFDYTPPKRPVVAEAPRWIPVTERTPTRRPDDGASQWVLAQTDDGEIITVFVFVLDGALVWSSGYARHRVVAWQPLPAPWVAP